MTGRHSSVHHVSSFNSNSTAANNQHHHNHNHNHHTPSSRLTRAALNSSTLVNHQSDMRVPTFPIDPNLGGNTPTHQNTTSTNSVNSAAGLSTPTNQTGLPSFQHHYDTRPQSSSTDPRAQQQYNSYNPQEYHQHATTQQQHQTPQTDYSGYDTSFGTEDQGTPTTNAILQQQQQQPTTSTPVGVPGTTDPNPKKFVV